jgi:predicted O-methyltransferase YrrM
MTWQDSVAWRPEIEGHSVDILPWMVEIAPRIPQGGTYIEVGVYKGRSFRFMREMRPDLAMIAIDPWTDASVAASGGEGWRVAVEFSRNMSGTQYAAIHGTLATAGLHEHGADLIFLDGDHNYPGVRADILSAKPLLKSGGILAGHDYAGDNGVCQAVRELVPGYQVSDWDGPDLPGAKPGKGRCWWKVMP